MPMRAPWNPALRDILTELYSAEEADLVTRMPHGLSTVDRLQRATGFDRIHLQRLLEPLCVKGLIIDIFLRGEYHYGPSPLVVGIYEFTMMRTGDPSTRKMARLFHAYMSADEAFYRTNFGKGEKISVLRAVAHEGTVAAEQTEILAYESAAEIIEGHRRFAIGLCSCRHEREHLGTRQCATPLATCSSFGIAADYVIRRGAAREVTQEEMLDNLARSRELGLVLCADNVRKNVSFLCHCCGCCCHGLRGIRERGYANPVVTSGFIPRTDEETCNGCGLCSRACPIDAITMQRTAGNGGERKGLPVTDHSICLGCGVCALACRPRARTLARGAKRVIQPETTFERIILQSLERGTLQYQLFDEPRGVSGRFMRGLLGGFLRLPPVKKALMSETLRSRFLDGLKRKAQAQGKGWMMEL